MNISVSVWASDGVVRNAEERDIALSKSETRALQAGKVIVHVQSEGNIKEIHAFLSIDAPPKQMLDTITDFKHLPEFMPHLEAIEVLEKDEQSALVNYMLSLPFGVHKRYRLQLQFGQNKQDITNVLA
ncbi:MAG: SRPBCC family protein [Ghiorsea sp.]